MKKIITDYIYFLWFALLIFLGTLVTIIILPFLVTAILMKRLYLFVLSRLNRWREEGETRKLERRKKSLQEEIEGLKKRVACFEKSVIEAREMKERIEEAGADTSFILKEIVPLEEVIEEKYGYLRYLEEELQKVSYRIVQLKKNEEKLPENGRSRDEYPE